MDLSLRKNSLATGLCVIPESCVYITFRGKKKKKLFRCKYVRESQERGEIILNYLGGSEGITRVFTRGRLKEGRRVRVRGGMAGREERMGQRRRERGV